MNDSNRSNININNKPIIRIPAPKNIQTLKQQSSSNINKIRLSDLTDLQTNKVEYFKKLDINDEKLLKIHKLLNHSRKITLLTGAGISSNAGIPDFRSFDGLYNQIKKDFPELSIRSGKELFDISLFRDENKINVFAKFMEMLYGNIKYAKPTKTHKFIGHLKNRNKLFRCYTQNIDGLEELTGLISNENEYDDKLDVIKLHGDINLLKCTNCFKKFEWNRYYCKMFKDGELPNCPRCIIISKERERLGKRMIDSIGFLKPDIVLYGENHPSADIIAKLISSDIKKNKTQFFIIMGTSLKVDGVKLMVKKLSKQVHDRNGIVLLINKSEIPMSTWGGIIDYQICVDCDDWVDYFKEIIPEFFKTQQQVDKIRQLKREASDLRKKERERKAMMKTPPNTPENIEENKIVNSLDIVKKRLLNEDEDESIIIEEKVVKRMNI